MATRASPLFTENLCMHFDRLILALVQLSRTLGLGVIDQGFVRGNEGALTSSGCNRCTDLSN
jgi:hypothetical protein